MEFTVSLDKVPTTARLVLMETGLSLTQHLAVWINGKRAGMITPVVPGAGRRGFFHRSGERDELCGLAQRVVLRAGIVAEGGRQHAAIFRRG